MYVRNNTECFIYSHVFNKLLQFLTCSVDIYGSIMIGLPLAIIRKSSILLPRIFTTGHGTLIQTNLLKPILWLSFSGTHAVTRRITSYSQIKVTLSEYEIPNNKQTYKLVYISTIILILVAKRSLLHSIKCHRGRSVSVVHGSWCADSFHISGN